MGDGPTQQVNQLADVKAILLAGDGAIPNNPKLPVLVYRGVLRLGGAGATARVRELFARNEWAGSWVNGIYDFHHYHSTAHEVLAVCGGQAKVQLGGQSGITTVVSAGDVVVLPAGTGHKNLGSSADFVVVGAYPRGQRYDMCYGEKGERPAADQRIARVPLPKADPLHGPEGPLMERWA
jgi:uncharacterized protein YjlB